MREIADELTAWLAAGRPFALATVARAWRSAPRGPGAAMAVDLAGDVVGSLSGGCVEAAVYDAALGVLEDPGTVLEHYGVVDDDAVAVGLACGGELDVLVRPITPGTPAAGCLRQVLGAVRREEPVSAVTVVGGPWHGATMGVWLDRVHGSVHADVDEQVVSTAREYLRRNHSGLVEIPALQGAALVEALPAPRRMVVFGAIDHAAAVCAIGRFLGFHVTLVDARPVFATPARFPDAHEVVVEWPHRYLESNPPDAGTALCVLTHDAKFDVPLLQIALRSSAAYVGVMGSRRTHADRVRRLRAEGLTEEELARMRAPVGLDIGASTPQEVAVAIAAEIVLAGHPERTGLPLGTTAGPLHTS